MIAVVDNNNWLRCANCGHKLGRVIGRSRYDPDFILEIKCHSCKEINEWHCNTTKKDVESQD